MFSVIYIKKNNMLYIILLIMFATVYAFLSSRNYKMLHCIMCWTICVENYIVTAPKCWP